MLVLSIFLEGDGMLKGLTPEERDGLIYLSAASDPMRIGVLERGLKSGKPSIAFGFKLPDGRWVFAETSAALFLAAAKAIDARYGEAAFADPQ